MLGAVERAKGVHVENALYDIAIGLKDLGDGLPHGARCLDALFLDDNALDEGGRVGANFFDYGTAEMLLDVGNDDLGTVPSK